MEKSLYLNQDDITEDIVIIKINQSYGPHMSALQLYDATRGCWRRKIESVENARYAFATYKGEVVEVYKIDYWCYASELNRETLPYNPERHKNRIGFSGSVAPKESRDKYIGNCQGAVLRYPHLSVCWWSTLYHTGSNKCICRRT